MRAGWMGARNAACCVAFFVALIVWCGVVPVAMADPPAADIRDVNALTAGDRIAVTVLGQPELSGEMMIDGAGNIVLPIIGAIHVEDLSSLECQQLIRAKLVDGFLRNPVVSVRVTEPRPIYVLGSVRSPGAYPFRYGTTVQSAIALAGGFGVAGLQRSAALIEFLSAEERVRQLGSDLIAQVVRERRLEAQLNGQDSFSPPQLPAADGDQKNIGQRIEAEKATLVAQRALIKQRTDLLAQQKPRLEQEIDSINVQIKSARERLEFVKNEIGRSVRLVQQGLGVHNSEFQLKLQQGSEETNLWRLVGQLSRLRMDLGELDIKIEDVRASAEKETLAELQRVRERVAELQITLPSAREIRDRKLQQADGIASAVRQISISRARHGKVTVSQASETTLLQAGDVIEVIQLVPQQPASAPSPAG